MSTRATCTFQIDAWNDSVYHDQDGIKLSRAQLTKTFHGDLEASSSVELLGVQGLPETSRAYVAVERIDGRLGGRSGSFVLLHTATATADGSLTRWVIVPDSATGELRGLRGEAHIDIDADSGHSMTLDYQLDVAPAELAPADLAPADLAPADLAPADVAPADVAPLIVQRCRAWVSSSARLGSSAAWSRVFVRSRPACARRVPSGTSASW